MAIDAMDLRRKVGKHPEAIRAIAPNNEAISRLRTWMGHASLEVAGGVAMGAAVAVLIQIVAGLISRP